MINCVFLNNKHDVSATNVNVPDYGKNAVIIRNCIFPDPLRLNTTPQWIKFVNCNITSFTNWQDDITISTPVRNIKFVNCNIDCLPSVMLTKDWHNHFFKCAINKVE